MQQSYNLVSYKIILKEEFLVIRLVQKDGMGLKDLSEEFQKSKLVVLAAVKKSHVPLLYAGDALKQDEQFITELVKIVNKNPVAFRISFKSSWLTDKEFMLKTNTT